MKTIDELRKKIDDLNKRVERLSWIIEHPPKFKYGDVIDVIEDSVDCVKIKKTFIVKNDGIVKEDILNFPYIFREYVIDDGSQIITWDEYYLLEMKEKYSKNL